MGKDDDDLYDELYGDDDDEAMPIPAAPPPKPAGFKIPKAVPATVEVPPPPPPPPAAPNADDDSDDDFDIALNEPDVGDPDDPDDFKIVLDDTEQLYGTGHTAEPYAEDASAPTADAADLAAMDGMPGAASDAPMDPRRAAQAPNDIHYRSKTYVREGAPPGRPPPPAPPRGCPPTSPRRARDRPLPRPRRVVRVSRPRGGPARLGDGGRRRSTAPPAPPPGAPACPSTEARP